MKFLDRIYDSRYRYLPMIVMIIAGAALGGISFNIFLMPHKLLSGGVSGIALILNYIFGFSPGVLVFVFNIPIFLAGYKYVDKEFILLSLIGMTAFSVFIDMFAFMKDIIYIDDVLLSCLYGGVFNGIGMGIVFRNRASQGGVDIVAVILKKYFSINLGTTSLLINIAVVTLGSYFYGIKLAMYTLVSMYVSSTVLDKVMKGFGSSKSVMIITDREQQVADTILATLGRGVTYLEGEGAYTKNKKRVIYCIVTLNQLAKLKQIVREVDGDAFMAVSDTSEVLGHGFASRGI
ncbi:MAG TPA: YitT family protein [Clostridia bacterium]|nr:YitT family protein [Clostridia bacterium]